MVKKFCKWFVAEDLIIQVPIAIGALVVLIAIATCVFAPSRILECVSVSAAVVAGIVGLITWQENVRTRRAEFLDSLVSRFYSDSVRNFFYRCIDSSCAESQDWFEVGFYDDVEGVQLQKEADASLAFFSYLCYLHESALITDTEFSFFGYQIGRLSSNDQTQHYLKWLTEQESDKGWANPFGALTRYTNAHMLIGGNEAENVSSDKERIGTYVRQKLFELLRSGRVKKGEVANLEKYDYCKKTFNIPFPVLKRADQVDGILHCRYYVSRIRIEESEYRVCNHWLESNRDQLELWMKAQAL